MIWLWLFFLKGSIIQSQQVEVVKTDTVYVNKPYKEIVIKEVEIEKPVKVFIYKTDTLYRQKLEKDTLISAIQIESKKATIHTVTPKGVPLVKEYPLGELKKLTINHKGDLKQIRKKKWKKLIRNIERISVFLSGIVIGVKVLN
tara:strand:- start:109 stop:540 length:432 start_codon:yes stop_codon:yes gene_type:complete